MFTPAQLAALRLADAAEDQRRLGGRPRTLPDTPDNERRRFRARAKAQGIDYERRMGGRPRKQDGQRAAERERKRAYYWRKKLGAMS